MSKAKTVKTRKSVVMVKSPVDKKLAQELNFVWNKLKGLKK